MNFSNLPTAVQTEVKSTLCAYNTCTVQRDDKGQYKVMTCIVLHTGVYAEMIGEYTSKEVFTLEERIINYVNTFREYPYHCSNGAHYTGKKDYKLISSNWTVAKMVNGDIVFK